MCWCLWQSADDITDSLGGASPVSTDVEGASPRSAVFSQHPSMVNLATVGSSNNAATAGNAAVIPGSEVSTERPSLTTVTERAGQEGAQPEEAISTAGGLPEEAPLAADRSAEPEQPQPENALGLPHFQVVGEALHLLFRFSDASGPEAGQIATLAPSGSMIYLYVLEFVNLSARRGSEDGLATGSCTYLHEEGMTVAMEVLLSLAKAPLEAALCLIQNTVDATANRSI